MLAVQCLHQIHRHKYTTILTSCYDNLCMSYAVNPTKQKHLGYKKVRGQLEAALQIDATKNFDIS